MYKNQDRREGGCSDRMKKSRYKKAKSNKQLMKKEAEMSKRTKEDILKLVKDKDVKFIRLWFTDVLGQVKSFAITDNELKGALERGMGFDGSSITGYQDI